MNCRASTRFVVETSPCTVGVVYHLWLSEDDLKIASARVKIILPRRSTKMFGSLRIVLLLDGVDYTDLLVLEQLQYQQCTVFNAMSWQRLRAVPYHLFSFLGQALQPRHP